MNAPFGQTGTATPLIWRAASPVPTLPKMKFESRAVSIWSGFGYVTLIRSGPRTSGTGGSLGLAGGSGAGTRGGTTTGAGAEGPVDGRQDAPARARQQAKTLIVEAFITRIWLHVYYRTSLSTHG